MIAAINITLVFLSPLDLMHPMLPVLTPSYCTEVATIVASFSGAVKVVNPLVNHGGCVPEFTTATNLTTSTNRQRYQGACILWRKEIHQVAGSGTKRYRACLWKSTGEIPIHNSDCNVL